MKVRRMTILSDNGMMEVEEDSIRKSEAQMDIGN
jgi:hypothetical protein